MPTSNPVASSNRNISIDSGICLSISGATITTTVSDVPGSNFTLNAAGKYLVIVTIYSQGSVLASDLLLDVVNATTNAPMPQSRVRVLTKVVNYASCSSIAFVLDNPTAGTSYKLRGNCGSGSHIISNGGQGNSTIVWQQQTNLNGNGATLRTINRASLLNNGTNLQAEFQAAYDQEIGLNAPDGTVPIAVVNAANALNDSQWKIYLGHTAWYYTNQTNTSTTTNWTVFGGNKSNFGAAIPANHIFTFK